MSVRERRVLSHREGLPTRIVRELLDDLAVELVFQQVLQQINKLNMHSIGSSST